MRPAACTCMQIYVTSTSRMSSPCNLFTRILKITVVVVAVAIAAAYLLSFIVSVLTLYGIHCNYSLAATLQLLLGYLCNCFNAGVAISCQNYSHLKQYFQ